MSERPPSSERDRFDSPRDRVLYLMCQTGWANASAGSRDSSTGWFARVTNYPIDTYEVQHAFEADLQANGVNAAELVGSYLVREREGAVQVFRLENDAQVVAVYDQLLAELRRR